MIPESRAEALLEGLVAIPSPSGQERPASAWLVAEMKTLRYDRAYVDEVGNAVGEFGPADAAQCIVLLGHIDTVPGCIPVERKETAAGPCLYGRGTVDAKGPLANFVLSAANARPALPSSLRLVVVGAVEEEAATSKGARVIRDRFDGVAAAHPLYCIIGEPSGAFSINRGYKGRVLIRLIGQQPTAHTAGPDREIAELAASYWQWLHSTLALVNRGKERLYDQASPSLREFNTTLWHHSENRVECLIGIRLPLHFHLDNLVQASLEWLAWQTGTPLPATIAATSPDRPLDFPFEGGAIKGRITFGGVEPAWLTPRRNHLCRSLQGAIRQEAGRKARFSVKTGTCDMNVVGPVWQCPVVAYGPGDSRLDHTPHEHIALPEFHASTRILTRALQTLYATV